MTIWPTSFFRSSGPAARTARSPAATPEHASRRTAWSWVTQQLQRWPDGESVHQQAGLLLAVPRPGAALIAIVDGLHADVRASFWEHMVPMRADPEARPLVVRRLIEHRRAWAALGVLVMMLPPAPDHRPSSRRRPRRVGAPRRGDRAVRRCAPCRLALVGGRPAARLPGAQRLGPPDTSAAGVPLHQPAPVLTRPARALDEALRADPALFAEILSYVYWAEDEPRDQDVPPERQALAEVGFAVLRSWHTPPGVRPDGTVDAERLRAWVTEARRLLPSPDGPPPETSRSARSSPCPARQRRTVARRTRPGSDRGPPVTRLRERPAQREAQQQGPRHVVPDRRRRPGTRPRRAVPSLGRARSRRLAPDRSPPAPARRRLRRMGTTGGRSIRGLRGPRPLTIDDGADHPRPRPRHSSGSAMAAGRKPAS